MERKTQYPSTIPFLLIAIVLGLVLHGASMLFTLEKTYDALIHLFFADHYANNWFEPWNPKWYTGFTVTGYPPLIHQSIAIFSKIAGLKFGLYSVALIGVTLFISGAYRYAYLITGNKNIAGYTALFASISSSFLETLHVFGQLPSILGISVLLHSLPFIYKWLRYKSWWHLIASLSLISITVASHHVTPIFGMIFFIFPVIGLVLMDHASEREGGISHVRIWHFLLSLKSLFWRTLGFGMASLAIIISVIIPYWINSKNNPITQVPIPHGSRDNYLEILSSGFIFFLLPWGILLLLLPYFFYRFYNKRYLFFGISLTILFVLGTGGTTAIPRKLLGETAFNILTLDRFTLWATILVLPLVGEWIYHFVNGKFKTYIIKSFGRLYHRILGLSLVSISLSVAVFTIILFEFRPSQPDKIDMLPIVNFLNQDDHDKWRYMTLGFGDQMAWLATQTDALSVDGNYHSARRLPELTSRAVERLENSKFLGIEGIGSLQQFLTIPHKYNLKYIFSNDKFYDPILHFTGWQRLTALENGIQVWERLYVPPLPNILPKDELPQWQKTYWGTIPVLTIFVTLFIFLLKPIEEKVIEINKNAKNRLSSVFIKFLHLWMYLLVGTIIYMVISYYNNHQRLNTPEKVLSHYYNAIDFKDFDKAYTLLDQELAPEKEDYLRQISVSDGVLNSYSKMNSIDVEIIEQSGNTAKASVTIESITPLQMIDNTRIHYLTKKENQWYIQPSNIETDLPPSLYVEQATIDFHLQGRRKVDSGQTYREDILRQPEVIVTQASLVEIESQYAIVGIIQNVDNLPADISILGSVYNNQNEKIASYNAMYIQKHVLLPQESSIFRIDFEDTAWKSEDSNKPTTFDPTITNQFAFDDPPASFDVHLTTNVSNANIYRSVSLNSVDIKEDKISGSLLNSGTKEITIPQLLIAYYDKNQKIKWAESVFLQSNIRQQRRITFETKITEPRSAKTIMRSTEKTFCNGTPMQELYRKHKFTNNNQQVSTYLIPNSQTGISLDINAFIGNPN
jgi:hypothetical protein